MHSSATPHLTYFDRLVSGTICERGIQVNLFPIRQIHRIGLISVQPSAIHRFMLRLQGGGNDGFEVWQYSLSTFDFQGKACLLHFQEWRHGENSRPGLWLEIEVGVSYAKRPRNAGGMYATEGEDGRYVVRCDAGKGSGKEMLFALVWKVMQSRGMTTSEGLAYKMN